MPSEGKKHRPVFVSVEDAYRYLAQAVLLRALNDVSEDELISHQGSDVADMAAFWFATGQHSPWCEVAGFDPDAAKSEARFRAVLTKLRRIGYDVERRHESEKKDLSRADRAWTYRNIFAGTRANRSRSRNRGARRG
jgi:hypothetical protein